MAEGETFQVKCHHKEDALACNKCGRLTHGQLMVKAQNDLCPQCKYNCEYCGLCNGTREYVTTKHWPLCNAKQLTEQNAHLQKEMQQKTDCLQERNVHLQEEVRQKEQMIVHLQEKVGQKEEQNVHLQEEVGQKEEKNVHLQEEIHRKEQQIVRLLEEVHNLQQENERKESVSFQDVTCMLQQG